MITAVLAIVFFWCLLYEIIPRAALIFVCAALGAVIALVGSHKHEHVLPIDVLAQRSRLRNVNPDMKFWVLFALMIISSASGNILTGVFLMAAALIIAVFAGGLSLREYTRILSLPASFLMIGGIALLFEATSAPVGVLNLRAPGFWLCVSAETQALTALVLTRAFGAVCCLCLLSVTTPMPDIIGVLRRAHCPDVIIDLMYLVYRYIFILLFLHNEMHNAAKSRLGFRDYRTGLYACGKIYSNLLARSYQFAGKNFDAMESRCYDSGIRFLERKRGVTSLQACVCAALLIICLLLNTVLL